MKHKRILLICLLLALLVAAVPAAAEGVSSSGTEAAAKTAATETPGGLSGFFTDLFGEHLAEMFGALALCGSCLVAVLYKTGLLPLLTRSLGSIGEAANRTASSAAALAEKIDFSEEETRRLIAPFCETASRLGNEMSAYAARLDDLARKLDAAETEREQLRLILSGETELLYGILQSAALPQYQKDAIAARYAETRRLLDGAPQ